MSVNLGADLLLPEVEKHRNETQNTNLYHSGLPLWIGSFLPDPLAWTLLRPLSSRHKKWKGEKVK